MTAAPAEVLDAARAGDEAALLQLLVLCRPDLTRYARRACESDDVEEAVQDALWVLYRRVGALRAGGALSAWLFQVVRRLCLRFTRKRSANHRATNAPRDDMPGAASDDDLRMDLVRAYARLPDAYRSVFVLRDVRGYEASEVATMLGLSVEAVKSRLHRARGFMREALQQERGDPSRPAGNPERTRP